MVDDVIDVDSNPSEESNSEPSYYFAEGIAGQGDKPDWFKGEKYKTVSDQAKAYKDLESRFGGFTGAPEAYQMNLPEGFKTVDDDPMLSAAQEWAKEQNMSQKGFDSLISMYAELEAGKDKAFEEYRNEQISQIDNFDNRNNAINGFLKANGMESLADSITSKDQMEQFEKLLDMAGKASIDPNAQPNNVPTQKEVDDLMFEKDQFGRTIYNYDKERQAQVRKMIEARVGRGDSRQMIG